MQNYQQSCPTEECLSEYYDLLRDGRLDAPLVEHLKIHVTRCARCQAIIQAYGQMDEAVAATLRHPAPVALAYHIRLECQRVASDDEAAAAALPPRPQSSLRYGWCRWVGAAAVVVIFAGAAVSFWHKTSEISSQTPAYDTSIAMGSPMMKPAVELREAAPVQAVAEAPEAAPEVAPSQAAPSEAVAAAPSEAVPAPAAEAERATTPSVEVQSKDLQNVSTRNRKADTRYAAVSKRRIGEMVRHVWTVEDLDKCRATLKSLEKNEGVKVLFDDAEQGKVVAVVQGITDRQLQQIVDKFDEFRWALVSPKLPQPKQPEAVAFENRPVVYSFCAVKGAR